MNATAPGFWEGLAEVRDAKLAGQPLKAPRSIHSHHMTLALGQVIQVCRPCAAKRADSMFRSGLLPASAAARAIARWNAQHPEERFGGYDDLVAANGYRVI